jgi:hypothetical protein
MGYFNPLREALHNMNVRLGTADIAPQNDPTTAQRESLPRKKMWTVFMKDAEKYDNRNAEDWKGDSDGILVFVRPTWPPAFYWPRCSSQ